MGAEATAFLARTTGLDATHTSLYTALIDGLVADGVWPALDALYIFATQDATTSLLSLVSSTFNATAVNSPTFAADAGYTSVAANAYINSNFNPSTASSPNFTQNSAHLAVWSNTNGISGNPAMGQGFQNNFFIKYTDGSLYSRINDNVESGGYALANSTGFLLGNRTSSTAIAAYKNGSLLGSASSASRAIANSNIRILTHDAVTFDTTHQIAVASIGRGLTATEITNFYNRLSTFLLFTVTQYAAFSTPQHDGQSLTQMMGY